MENRLCSIQTLETNDLRQLRQTRMIIHKCTCIVIVFVGAPGCVKYTLNSVLHISHYGSYNLMRMFRLGWTTGALSQEKLLFLLWCLKAINGFVCVWIKVGFMIHERTWIVIVFIGAPGGGKYTLNSVLHIVTLRKL